MRQYLEAVKEVMERGTRKPNRTGIDTISTFGIHYNIDLRAGFPLLTTKHVSWKNIVIENLWFLSGRTDVGILRQHGCKFWDAWADETGKVPSAYGNFWRQFPVHRTVKDLFDNDVELGHFNDQIAWLVNELKANPMSRRMVVSAWAPGNAQASKLPPCHFAWLLNVQNEPDVVCTCPDWWFSGDFALRAALRRQPHGRGALSHHENCNETDRHAHAHPLGTRQVLCLHITQRSCDMALGVPYNIAGYAFLTHLFARFAGLEVGTLSHMLCDAHIYTTSLPDKAAFDHMPGLREQLTRQPRQLPRLIISDEIRSLGDVERLMQPEVTTEEVMRHFVLEDYDPHPPINFKAAV